MPLSMWEDARASPLSPILRDQTSAPVEAEDTATLAFQSHTPTFPRLLAVSFAHYHINSSEILVNLA